MEIEASNGNGQYLPASGMLPGPAKLFAEVDVTLRATSSCRGSCSRVTLVDFLDLKSCVPAAGKAGTFMTTYGGSGACCLKRWPRTSFAPRPW